MVLIVFDKNAEISYTKDLTGELGMYVAPFDAANDNSKNFFVQAQHDGGYQKFFNPLNSDPIFKEFLRLSDAKATEMGKPAAPTWGIYAAGTPDFTGPGSMNFFTTLNSTVLEAGVNPQWTLLKGTNNQTLQDAAGAFGSFVADLNTGRSSSNGANGADHPFNTHFRPEFLDPENVIDFSLSNGSSLDLKGSSPYFPLAGGLGGVEGQFSNTGAYTTNPVGSSSWFYYLTPSNVNGTAKVLLDEFDNLSHDGYWGLAVKDGNYILSFTMQAHVGRPTTAQGFVRRNLTDFSALYGGVRSLAAPSDEFIGWQPSGNFGAVTAVPEPATYGLFGLGLAALAWRRRHAARQA